MSKKELIVMIDEMRQRTEDVFIASFRSAFIATNAQPGTFLHVKVPYTTLRRPLSIHNIQGDKVSILFRIRGRGTKILSQYKKGDQLNVIGPLGEGFRLGKPHKLEQHILIAGGMGVAPLLFLGKRLRDNDNNFDGQRYVVILGAKTKEAVVCEDEFRSLKYMVYVATEDGSKGCKGTVIDILAKLFYSRPATLFSNIYACGPEAMFRQVYEVIKGYPRITCQVSFEQFMGCGLGICCGCSIETKYGYKKVCKDGPVFNIEDIYNEEMIYQHAK